MPISQHLESNRAQQQVSEQVACNACSSCFAAASSTEPSLNAPRPQACCIDAVAACGPEPAAHLFAAHAEGHAHGIHQVPLHHPYLLHAHNMQMGSALTAGTKSGGEHKGQSASLHAARRPGCTRLLKTNVDTLTQNVATSLAGCSASMLPISPVFSCCNLHCPAVLTPKFLGGLGPSGAGAFFFTCSFFFCCSLCNLHSTGWISTPTVSPHQCAGQVTWYVPGPACSLTLLDPAVPL